MFVYMFEACLLCSLRSMNNKFSPPSSIRQYTLFLNLTKDMVSMYKFLQIDGTDLQN